MVKAYQELKKEGESLLKKVGADHKAYKRNQESLVRKCGELNCNDEAISLLTELIKH